MFVRTVVKLLQYLFIHFLIQHHVNWFSGHFVITLKQIFLQNMNHLEATLFSLDWMFGRLLKHKCEMSCPGR